MLHRRDGFPPETGHMLHECYMYRQKGKHSESQREGRTYSFPRFETLSFLTHGRANPTVVRQTRIITTRGETERPVTEERKRNITSRVDEESDERGEMCWR